LYRISVSPYSDRFVLKGALLFNVWTGQMHRPTRDLDVLGYWDNSPDAIAALFRQLCVIQVPPDGLQFDPNAIQVSRIREDQEYEGHRVRVLARLGKGLIPLHVDIGIGDQVVPGPEDAIYPVLLPGTPAPRLHVYPKEAAAAEKLHAIVTLGAGNSRMKDFYDLRVMAREFSFNGVLLRKAIAATFERRNTALPEVQPVGLTVEFSQDASKQAQWRAFVTRSRLEANAPALDAVVEELLAFLLPVIAAARETSFERHWIPGGPWR
jgi:predicted nucleotidyltransferase component of viral defense system